MIFLLKIKIPQRFAPGLIDHLIKIIRMTIIFRDAFLSFLLR